MDIWKNVSNGHECMGNEFIRNEKLVFSVIQKAVIFLSVWLIYVYL